MWLVCREARDGLPVLTTWNQATGRQSRYEGARTKFVSDNTYQ